MRLVELRPYIRPGTSRVYETLHFLCPGCLKTEIGVAFWEGAPTSLEVGKLPDGQPEVHKIWQVTGDCFDNMSLSPSIDHSGRCRHCAGWHGHITNGEIQP